MNNNRRVSDIKRAQKTSLLFRTITKLFSETLFDNKDLTGFYVNRVELSPDKGICYVYFYAPGGEADFKEKLHLLKLYKPSTRAAIAREVQGRYAPDIVFKFDKIEVKARHIDDLLNKIKFEDTPSNDDFDTE